MEKLKTPEKADREAKVKALKNLFAFANETEIDTLDHGSLVSLLSDYVSFTCVYKERYPSLRFDRRFKMLTNDLMDGKAGRSIQATALTIMLTLHSHVRDRLGCITATSDYSGTPSEEVFHLELEKCTRRIFVDPETNQFMDAFSLDGIGTEGSAEYENKLTDMILMDLVHDLGLGTDRFGRCEFCSNFMFQATAKKIRFCSKRCAGNYHQREYVKRQGKKDKSIGNNQ